MQRAKLRFCRLVLGELDQITTGQEFSQTQFLFWRQQIARLQFIKELFGRAVRSMELKTRLQINANGARYRSGKRLGLADERQRVFQHATGMHMGRDGRRHSQRGRFFPPITPEKPAGHCQHQNSDDPEKPEPEIGNGDQRFHRVPKSRRYRVGRGGRLSWNDERRVRVHVYPWRRRFSRVSKNWPRAEA